MRNLVKINKDTSLVYNTLISEYINPDFVYVPMKNNYTLLVKTGDYVYKDQVIMEDNLNKIISPVSGKITDFQRFCVDGVTRNTIIIENDFKEKVRYNRKRNDLLNKESIVNRLYEFYFRDIANLLDTKKINNLVINGIDDEPYIYNNEYITSKYYKEILEMADIFTHNFSINRTIIVLKSNNTKNIDGLLSRIGTYPEITLSLVDDKYLIGKDFFLLEHLNIKYDDALVIDVKKILEMYSAIKYGKYYSETFITIAGSGITKSKIIKVKEGTLLKDIIANNIKIKNDGQEKQYILNGLLTGKKCNIDKTVVTKDTLGVIIIPYEEHEVLECSNCGLCYKICPVKVNPKKVMDSKKVSKKCIDCGLCSYICPCYINLRKYLRGYHE